MFYRALYDYTPSSEDELPLRTGAILHVTRICDDGWCLGADPTSGAVGTFPGNYVAPVAPDDSAAAVAAAATTAAAATGGPQAINYQSYFQQISKKSEQ